MEEGDEQAQFYHDFEETFILMFFLKAASLGSARKPAKQDQTNQTPDRVDLNAVQATACPSLPLPMKHGGKPPIPMLQMSTQGPITDISAKVGVFSI